MTGVENVGVFLRETVWLRLFFEPNLFPYKYPNILNPSYTSYLLAYEDGTECSETLAFKLQTPVNHQEKAYDIQNTAKV
jgi:hypothetical protein